MSPHVARGREANNNCCLSLVARAGRWSHGCDTRRGALAPRRAWIV